MEFVSLLLGRFRIVITQGRYGEIVNENVEKRRYLDRVKQLDILLEENRGYLKNFGHLKR